MLFSSRNQSSGNFFLKSPITPSKVKWSASGQFTDSDLSIISKGFWNNRGQSSLGERGEICFYLPLPGESARWRHNQILLPMKLRCPVDTPLGRTKTSDSSDCITKPSDSYAHVNWSSGTGFHCVTAFSRQRWSSVVTSSWSGCRVFFWMLRFCTVTRGIWRFQLICAGTEQLVPRLQRIDRE